MAECGACKQTYELMIAFECGHEECVFCFSARPRTSGGGLRCAVCSHTTRHFHYAFQTEMACDLCAARKPNHDFWWCDDCAQTVCSLCAMERHKSCLTSRWNQMKIWKYYVEGTEGRIERRLAAEKGRADAFLDRLRAHLHAQMDASAKLARQQLAKDDALISTTFEMADDQKANKLRPVESENADEAEKRRLRAKRHLAAMLQNLRFSGRRLEFSLKLRQFVEPADCSLNCTLVDVDVDDL